MLPNFLGIGTQRAATTWLFNCLKEHPDIFVPDVKELHFYDTHFTQGLAYYSSFFREANECKAVGEITPDYLHCKLSAERIYQNLPDIKMIVILRNPIERAYSEYKIFHFPETGWNFEKTIEHRSVLLERGLYYMHLKRYFSFFKREQFLILLYEDLARDNLRALKAIFKFLGVDTEYQPTWLGKTSNPSVFPKITKIIGKDHFAWSIELVKKMPFSSILRKFYLQRNHKIGSNIRKQIQIDLGEYFHEPNRKLANLINRDLSVWN